ncbi:LOW QUALITY PROTEIN: uncharacterized protein LOC113566340 [Drosophila persimilis]|uniref:LOW QUALITY PROTEIN: uncharacterized protein LOC113566340 n=1 Tax=Drosophila persimilis TaxID=7234 RepID=UPI000F08E4CB|nr:LOW QUALITY PROTEIN: uncharacterized protein LOC113566340 [Drosophila persimilis]
MGYWQIQTKTRSNTNCFNMHRMLLYTLVIVALALVQACHQIHYNLTFPAVNQVCSELSLGQSLTRDLSTMSMSLSVSPLAPNLCRHGNHFTLGH